MTAAIEPTQGVVITAIVAIAAVLIALGIAYLHYLKAHEPEVMKAQAEIDDKRMSSSAQLKHAERMAQIEYDRAQDLLQSDKRRRELENRRLELEIENPKPKPEPPADKKWSDE